MDWGEFIQVCIVAAEWMNDALPKADRLLLGLRGRHRWIHPVLIEANTVAGSIWLAQMPHNDGIFGNDTSDILEWTGLMKRTKWAK